MKIVDKTNEIKEVLDRISRNIQDMNEEIHKPTKNFSPDRFIRLQDEYAVNAKKLSSLFKERSVLIQKWSDDVSVEIKRHSNSLCR